MGEEREDEEKSVNFDLQTLLTLNITMLLCLIVFVGANRGLSDEISIDEVGLV